MPSKTRKLEQTGKLIQILVKNKALLYKCLTKGAVDGGQCRRILMGKISAAIEDERFQTWPQIEAWARKNYHRQLRKSRGNQIQKSGCNPRVSFEDLVPVVRTSEIATNVQRLLDSVIDAVGTQDLQETCRHVLTGSGLPDDLKSFIFTQEFFGIWETHIRKATSDSDAENIDNMEGEQARQREQGECDISAGRSNADQVQVQSQIHSQAQSLAARTARIAEKEPERVPRPSPAPIVRLFADMNVASVIPDPDPGAEVISSTGGHLSDISGQIDRSSVDHESNTSATSTPKRKRRPKKKTAAAQGQEDQHTPKPSTQADAYGNARPKETPIPVPIPFPIPRTVSAPTPTLIPNVLSPTNRASRTSESTTSGSVSEEDHACSQKKAAARGITSRAILLAAERADGMGEFSMAAAAPEPVTPGESPAGEGYQMASDSAEQEAAGAAHGGDAADDGRANRGEMANTGLGWQEGPSSRAESRVSRAAAYHGQH
ncbi:hypothetical protein GGR51DRAFT_567448 [Nemania sp. FL0031]|nr:hypothetical protein GGR51DRAFT_567448 [Nemania sp. FL0031]